ncbi:Maf1-domain-containing protein [Auriscalpium vulgare]|uniref:Maf1-domain-containing protein n=1 Tax=Auriscalpium vulgare TaxID=40419 RepID=A0ACB8RLV0_9AGAM|nr:Maf1-domain-containing protein [Auriscalpium vulgare]
MKYIEIPGLARLAQQLTHEGPECSVHTRIEAYSCKNIKRDKKLFKQLETAYNDDVSHSPPVPSFAALDREEADMTPFGPLADHAARKTLYLLIATLNVAFPDHEFSDVKPAHFTKEQSGAPVLNALSTTLIAPHRAGERAPRTYSAYPPTSTDFFPSSRPTSSSPAQPLASPLAPPPIVAGTHPSLYRLLDDAIGLPDCEVFAYAPDLEADPHAADFSDDEDDVASAGESDSSDDDGSDGPFAFDDYDVDEERPARPWSPDDAAPRMYGRRHGALLWSSHWFFLNRKLKRILFVSVWARARGAARWAEAGALGGKPLYSSADKLPSISGERFLGWEGAIGAGARAMGLSASARRPEEHSDKHGGGLGVEEREHYGFAERVHSGDVLESTEQTHCESEMKKDVAAEGWRGVAPFCIPTSSQTLWCSGAYRDSRLLSTQKAGTSPRERGADGGGRSREGSMGREGDAEIDGRAGHVIVVSLASLGEVAMPELTTLPPEVLDEIVSWIPLPEDIVSFALTSKTLASVASPRHIHLRDITCTRAALCVWQLLSSDASLARNVRYLTICHAASSDYIVPTPYMQCASDCSHNFADDLGADFAAIDDVMRQGERLMIAALKNMSNLILLEWEDSDANTVIANEETDNQDVWSALATTPVERLVILENGGCAIWYSQVFSVSNLVIFDYTTEIMDWGGDPPVSPDCSQLVALLRDRCPRLQELFLQFTSHPEDGFAPPNLGETLFTTQWRDLRAVRLQNVASTPAAVASFISAHPSLRSLWIDDWFGCSSLFHDNFEYPSWDPTIALRLPLPPGVLPNLESLHCAPVQATSIIRSILSSDPAGRMTDSTLSVSVNVAPHLGDGGIEDLEEFISIMKDLPPTITVENREYVEDAVHDRRWFRERWREKLAATATL